jgi:hypothetical protein
MARQGPSDAWWDRLSAPCPEPTGTRISLLHMSDDPAPLPPGSEGTVTGGNGIQIMVEWDSGRNLMLIPGFDTYRVLSRPGEE